MIGVGLLIIGLVTSIKFSTDNEAGKSLGIIMMMQVLPYLVDLELSLSNKEPNLTLCTRILLRQYVNI